MNYINYHHQQLGVNLSQLWIEHGAGPSSLDVRACQKLVPSQSFVLGTKTVITGRDVFN
jgi:hypothetical protein